MSVQNRPVPEVVLGWIQLYRSDSNDRNREEHWWSFEQMEKWRTSDPEKIWQAIVAVVEQCDDDRVLANLAAGPMEDLLGDHGSEFIDRIESMARSNEKLRSLLLGVWRRDRVSDGLWNRFSDCRGSME